MTVTHDSFRQAFPEFTDPANYPDGLIDFWLGLATKMLNAPRWVDFLDEGLMLFTAHNIVLEKQARDASRTGAAPGTNAGVVASKSVGPVSISYDTGAGIVQDAGHWNLTTYGTRFMWMVNMVGMGPVQISGCGGSGLSIGAWAGPPFWPGWSGEWI